MDIQQAKQIVTALANGVDPITGEILPNTSPYNKPDVIRALFTILDFRKTVKKSKKSVEEKQKANLMAGLPKNSGLPWSPELIAQVEEKYNRGISLTELARYFYRSENSIASILLRQGLIKSKDDVIRQ